MMCQLVSWLLNWFSLKELPGYISRTGRNNCRAGCFKLRATVWWSKSINNRAGWAFWGYWCLGVVPSQPPADLCLITVGPPEPPMNWSQQRRMMNASFHLGNYWGWGPLVHLCSYTEIGLELLKNWTNDASDWGSRRRCTNKTCWSCYLCCLNERHGDKAWEIRVKNTRENVQIG